MTNTDAKADLRKIISIKYKTIVTKIVKLKALLSYFHNNTFYKLSKEESNLPIH